ncbi:MAG: TonB-dependent receptor [Janthinobacterium lividum]
MPSKIVCEAIATLIVAAVPVPLAAQVAEQAVPPVSGAPVAQAAGGVQGASTDPVVAPDRVPAEAPAAGDIIVTAQRRSESLQKVPLSVSVATAEDLAKRNFTDPAQLPLLVPSLQLTSYQGSPGATNFSIRGIGTASFSHLVEPTVATVIDGIVMSRPEMGVAEFSDLARVEVLNGPQGMLFGKNASAGLVNIVTNRPKLGSFEGFANASYENVEAADNASVYKINSTLNVPLTDIAAARITGFYTNQGSLIGNTQPTGFHDFSYKQFGARAKLLIDPGQGLSVYIIGDYTKSDGLGTGAFTPRAQGPALAPLEAAAGIVPSPNNLYQSGEAPSDLHYQIAGAQAEINYAFASGITLTDIIGYRSYVSNHTLDLDLLQGDLLSASAARFRFEQFSNELRLASPSGGALEYQAGLFYLQAFDRRQDRIRGQLGMTTPPPTGTYWLGLNAQDDLSSQSYAGYAQATYHLTSKFSLTGGGRVTHDDLDFMGGYNQDDIFITIAGGPGAANFHRKQEATNFSWRASAQYVLAPSVNFYATVARGYKGPGFNLSWAGSPGAQPVGPETSMDYEGGVKATFGKLLIDVSAYWEDFSNFQVQSFLASGTPGVGSFIIQNAGKLRARGVEGNFSLRLSPQLTLSGAGAYNDAVYRSFLGAPCYVGQTVAQGCVNGAVDASGNRLVNAPRWTGNLAADYTVPIGQRFNVTAHADVYAHTRVNFSPNNDPSTVQGGFAVVNGALAFSPTGGNWTLRAFCRNCLDQRFVSAINSTVVGGAGDYGQSFALDSFRSVGLAVNLRY